MRILLILAFVALVFALNLGLKEKDIKEAKLLYSKL